MENFIEINCEFIYVKGELFFLKDLYGDYEAGYFTTFWNRARYLSMKYCRNSDFYKYALLSKVHAPLCYLDWL